MNKLVDRTKSTSINALIPRLLLLILLPLQLLSGCTTPEAKPVVIVYTSVDQPFAQPVFSRFEEETGIVVKAVYDVEATKTTGLVNRLIAEASRPQADVFWNNEFIQTLHLQSKQVLQPYSSPQATEIPGKFRDPENYWTGITGRIRVLIVNTARIADPAAIDSLDSFLDESFSGRDSGIANPLFGTSATHAAALYQLLGSQTGLNFYQALLSRGVQVLDGNSVVRDLVASGDLAFGLTDSDDACGALKRGDPVEVVLPDQDGMGTLLIPATVAMIAGAPHPENGKALIDFLLQAETEQMLIDSGFSHIAFHAGVSAGDSCFNSQSIRTMDLDYPEIYQNFELIQSELRSVFLN